MDNEVAEARARLAARFGKVQLGGKGTSTVTLTCALWHGLSLGLGQFSQLICSYRYSEKSSEETP